MNKYTHKDGTPFTKEEFLKKLETDDEFNEEFGNKGIDQISDLIKQLKDNPDSRRLMVNAWAVDDLSEMVLPPCHYGFQCYTKELTFEERLVLKNKKYPIDTDDLDTEGKLDRYGIPKRKLSLMWNQRSVDTFLGLPFNIASYGLLLEIIAKEVNMIPDELIGNLGDTHLYLDHLEQAGEQIGRELTLEERFQIWFDEKTPHKFVVEDYEKKDILNRRKFLDERDVPTNSRYPYRLPKLKIENDVVWKVDDCLPHYEPSDFTLDNYKSHPAIKAHLSN